MHCWADIYTTLFFVANDLFELRPLIITLNLSIVFKLCHYMYILEHCITLHNLNMLLTPFLIVLCATRDVT